MKHLLKKRTQLLCWSFILLSVSLFADHCVEHISPSTVDHCKNLDPKLTPCTTCEEDSTSASLGATSGLPSNSCEKPGSSVDSFSLAYMDVLTDSARVDGVSGCGPCGGGGASGGISKLSLRRNYVSRKGYRVWDMGLGQSSNLDFRLTLSEETDGSLSIYQESPQASFSYMFLDGRRGDVRDGIFHGAQNNASIEMHLLDSNDNIVLNYADAVKIRFVDFKFTTFEYEVIALSSNNEYAGRLTSIKNLNGHGVDINYINPRFSVQDLINDPTLDPALQWRRSSATDSTGRTFNFTYHTAAIGGDYVISAVTLPNSSVITYDYTDTYLSKVTYPDGSFSTYSYSTVSNGDTVYHAQETSGKVKDIYMTSSVADSHSTHTGAILYNQSSMAAGTVVVNNEITYAFYSMGGDGAYVYTGENQMKKRHLDREVRYLKEDFTYSQDSNGNITADLISGTFEDTFLLRNYDGPNGSEYPTNVKNNNGNKLKVIYDHKNRMIVKSYSDNTFEAWSYNDLNQQTRHRDRLGRITLKSYDSRGNLLTREVGLLDSFTGGLGSYSSVYWGTSNLTQIPGTQASQSNAGGAAKAIDNNTNGQVSMYSVAVIQSQVQPWWRVKLVRSSLVDTIKVHNSKEFSTHLADFTVTVFDAGIEVYQQHIPDVVDSEGMLEITLPVGTYGDEVEIKLNGTNSLRLAEVQVFGIDTVADALEPIVDLATADYGIYTKEYYPTGHQNEHLLRYEFDANNNRTEYIYDASHNLLQVNEPDDAGTGYHAKNIMTYDVYNRIITSTDAVGRTTAVEYDARERLIKTTYNDGSTELNIYGTGLRADLIVKRKDRNGNVTKTEYDDAVRVTKTIRAYSVMSDDGSTETINPASLQSFTETTYLMGQKVARTVNVDGDITEYIRDYRLRPVSIIRHADSNSALTTTKQYESNRLFKSTDPYGRGTFYGYRTSDSAMIRTVQETVPGAVTRTTNGALLTLGRDNSLNAGYLMTVYEIDTEGQKTAVFDQRNIRHETDYDSRGRVTFNIQAANSLNQTTQRVYDANSNVISSIDPMGNVTNMAYTNRNLTASRTVAAGSLVEATESFTYYNDGRAFEHVDFNNQTTRRVWHQCCGRLQASIDQAGNYQVSNNDFYSNVTHTAVVDGATAITDYHDLPDGAILSEITTRYDSRHRPTARTVWLQSPGDVDPNDVPIATDPAQGLTTYFLYYDEVDGHGELTPLLTELAADGISFDSNNDGSAAIVINPEGEVQVSIQDGAGRTIAQGAYNKDDFANSTYTLVTWSTVIHDTVTPAGLLETKQISALNFVNKSRSDGARRTIEVEDAEGNISTRSFDNNGNVVSSRDANGVGQDCVFDDLNRDVSCTDTEGSVVTKVFDLNNNLLESYDSKNQITRSVYDARNRRETSTDRLNGITSFGYDDNSNLLTISDALNKVTTYGYDARNLQTSVTYADGKSTTCDFDGLRRKSVCTDQLGEKVDYNYDLAGRMTQRLYKLADDSIESTDSFTYDLASRPLTATKGRYNNTVTYTYDSIGRRQTETLTTGSTGVSPVSFVTTCAYDADNREVSCTYPNGDVVVKNYTDRNQLESLSFNAASIADFTYDNGRREATRSFGNSIVSTKAYNLDNTLNNITSSAGSAGILPALSFSYTYDANKNVGEEASTGIMSDYSWTASFDAADRVTSWNRSTGVSAVISSQSWNLDLIGNWTSVNTSGQAGFSLEERTHNDMHELTDIGGQAATYDDKGNLLSGAPLSAAALTWDIDNHLASVTNNDYGTTTFTYDAIGRRVSKGSTLFISHGQRVIEEYTESAGSYSLDRSYIHGTYVDDILAKVEANGGTPSIHYYHSDRQYNVRGLTNSSGDIVELYAYTPYGKQTVLTPSTSILAGSSHNNNYGFTGRYLDDETGLWYFRARYFSDELGRFISRDPLGYVDGYGLYGAYFAQKFGMDPSGTCAIIDPVCLNDCDIIFDDGLESIGIQLAAATLACALSGWWTGPAGVATCIGVSAAVATGAAVALALAYDRCTARCPCSCPVGGSV
jgi:RHS repeat-associated protein